MKEYILKKKIFTVFFLAAIFGYSFVNAGHGVKAWREALLEGEESQVGERIDSLNNSILESMYGRMNFIETYSYIQAILDKREFNDFSYIKDEDGYLHYASFFREDTEDVREYAKRVKRLQDYVEEKGTKVLFCVTPGKYVRSETSFRQGMPVNDPNNTVNELLFYLNRYGVETLDYREYIPNESLSLKDAFFSTDHHWTIPAAFEAARILVQVMEERFGAVLDPEGYYLDPDNYESVTYRKTMLGSMGRKTGANFSGVEDFEALWPKFTNRYEREYMHGSDILQSSEGTTQEVLMYTKVLTRNSEIYNDSMYSLYLNELCNFEKIVNKDNPDGSRVLAIRDSYFTPVIVFLAPVCGEIDAIWSLEKSPMLNIETYIKENDFDYIIIEIYPYGINEDAFGFFYGG